MDSRFNFLDADQVELLREILARRDPTLSDRIRQASVVSRSDAEEIMSVVTAEVENNLDDDWEPTEHGLVVSAVLAQFNAARLTEWP